MKSFIYVFSREDCEKLLQMGYKLLKEDGSTFVFVNTSADTGCLKGIDHVCTDAIAL